MGKSGWAKQLSYFFAGHEGPVSYWHISRILTSIVLHSTVIYFLVGSGLSLWSTYEINRQAYRDYQLRTLTEQEESARNIANRCSVIIEPTMTFSECILTELLAYQKTDTVDKDLQAQQEMATWALWSLVATWAGLAVSIGGFFVLWRSLRQTREAISIDREVGHAQVRAYLGFELEPPAGCIPGRIPEATFRIINTGQSPARKVRHSSFIGVFDHPFVDWQGPLLKEPSDLKIPSVTLRAGGDFNDTASMKTPLSKELFNEIANGGPKRIYVIAKVTYEDVFGQERMSELAGYLEIKYEELDEEKFFGRFDWILSHVRNDST